MTSDPRRAAVLDEIDGSVAEMTQRLVELVRAPSVGGTDVESSAQAALAAELARDGLEVDHWQVPLRELESRPDFPGMEVERSEAWGLVGRLPGTGEGPSLMLNGHIDVVPEGDRATWADDPFSGTIRDGQLYGRGACDMKGGLLSAVWAITALRRSGARLQGDVLLASVQGEEDGGMGTYALLDRGWRADACIIPEPTSLDLVPANAGALTFRLTVRGLATHASRRLSGVSAIEKFWPFWEALGALESRRNSRRDPLVDRWTLPYPLSVGMVSAGSWASSVPDVLVAEGRLGVALGEPVEDARASLELAVAEVCDSDPWLKEHPVAVEWWGGQFAPGALPEGSDLIERMADAHRAAGGATQETWAAPYGSDLRLMVSTGGVPTLQYGPGDTRLAHGPDESVPLAEVALAARALAFLALDVCG